MNLLVFAHMTLSALRVDRAQNEIVSVAIVLHQSGFPQMQHGRPFETRVYTVATPAIYTRCQPLVFTPRNSIPSISRLCGKKAMGKVYRQQFWTGEDQ